MKTNTQNLGILFGGSLVIVDRIDGKSVSVFVRALPQRYLSYVIESAEWPHVLVELACYFEASSAEGKAAAKLSPSHPNIVPPSGMVPVPLHFTDSLTDASVTQLHEVVKKLNFTRAVTWAETQIAAKKWVAPLHTKVMEQLNPVVDRVLKPLLAKLESLSASTSVAPPSSAAPGSSS